MLTTNQNGRGSNAALILLAPNFIEGNIVFCLEQLRQAGIPVSLVGLSAGLIKGYHGMIVKPDYSLGQLSTIHGHKLVLLPDGKACIAALFADPRVHQLIKTTLKNNGLVAAMPDAEVMLEKSNLISAETASNFLWQRDHDLKTFTEQMITFLA